MTLPEHARLSSGEWTRWALEYAESAPSAYGRAVFAWRFCLPECERRAYFGMRRFEWREDDSLVFHLGYADWSRLLVRCGLEVLDLVELRAPAARKLASP